MTYEDSSTKSDRSWKDLVTGWCVSEPSTTIYRPIMISILLRIPTATAAADC